MASVARLLTYVEIADERGFSVSARHEAVLADGRRLVLLDDRGWSHGSRHSWAYETAESLTRAARDVVGPDEPFGEETQADMEAGHSDALARALREHGVEAEPAELRALPHDVELSDRVLARMHAA